MIDEELATKEQTITNGGDQSSTESKAEATGGDQKPPAEGKAEQESAKSAPKTIATGADGEEEAKAKEDQKAAEKAANPDPWKLTDDVRKAIAEHYAAGDKKIYEKELKRLQRIDDVRHVWGMYRELEGKFTSGGLIKIPGKDAKEEDIAAFRKALGVPEKPEEYFDKIQLENGVVIGDADKPLVNTFAEAVHKAGATPEVMSAALNWYYQMQEQQAAEIDQADNEFHVEGIRTLKEDWGPSFNRRINAIASVFATAPGGADPDNPESLYAQIVTARTSDGRILGDNPDFIRWLDYIRGEINPAATVVESGDNSGRSIDEEIAAIEKRMKEDRRGYFKDEAMQARYRELLQAREKVRARRA